ncbi:MAG: hypothetical protein RRA92_07855 [Gemmatimonadota bacterium]|nr:hypothetical protein [Gemmatimonadota bacterium]
MTRAGRKRPCPARLRCAILAAAVCMGLAGAPARLAGQSEGLGMLSFPSSGAPGAQHAFLRGMLLLHSFEYEDAAEAFREAQAVDPGFAMAYWGEALTWQRLLWGQDFLSEARAALAKLGPDPAARAAKAGTARERAYLVALETLLGDGTLDERARGFERGMAAVHTVYPEDDEAAAFHALSILMAGDPRDPATAARSAALVEDVARRNPYHPGAIHYLIHSYDSPVLAPLGLHWARVYSRLAPEAEHALHMPSHIFIHLGMWDEVAASNEASIRASYAWVARKGLGVLDLDFHSHQWLSYAYQQQGRRAAARAVTDTVLRLLEGRDVSGRHWNVANGILIQQVQWGFETGDWSWFDGRAIPAVDPAGGFLPYALPLYGHGMAAAARSDGETVVHVTRALRAEGGPNPAARRVMAGQVEALLALRTGDRERAAALSTDAVRDAASFRVGSPAVFQPPFELHGEILLAAGRHAEAAAAFDRALEGHPQRARSLLGRARAAAGAGDEEAATRFYGLLVEMWDRADPGLPGLDEARRGAAGDDAN